MSCENNTRRRGECSFDYADNIGNTQTTKQRPEKKILETSRTGGEVVDQRVIFHVDSDKIIKTRSGEIEDSRNFLGVEKVGRFIPMLPVNQRTMTYNPHSLQIIGKKVEQWITRKKAQSRVSQLMKDIRIRNPVILTLKSECRKTRFRTLPQLGDSLLSFIVRPGPYSEGDTVESMRRVLLNDKVMRRAGGLVF
jgi:hypothetical protein